MKGFHFFCRGLSFGGLLATSAVILIASANSALSADAIVTVNPNDAALQWVECGEPFPKGCEFTGLFGDPEKTPIGSFVRSPAGYRFVNHSHPSDEHIVVIKGRLTGGLMGGAESLTPTGGYIKFPANLPHWGKCEEACILYMVYDKAPYGVKAH